MKKLKNKKMNWLLYAAATFTFVLTLAACNDDDVVGWHEENAKYKGVIKYGLPTQVYCCTPGDNCAKRQVIDYVGKSIEPYIGNNNIKGYFEHENWQVLFPELVNRPNDVALIKSINPLVKYVNNALGAKSIVIFKTADPTKTNTEDILFLLNNMDEAANDPCPGDDESL
jgi:hypothetical protein